ncbi:complement receptor type 2-like [Lytechinus pictus]|uniref:complement receptor type 2-like n=1 Tax=Lytechinus pictus TaxID=7653 RepID=UPI0030BA08F2
MHLIWMLVHTTALFKICSAVGGIVCGTDECSPPMVFGGGTPTFTPASPCIHNGTIVDVTCNGILFGQSECACVESDYVDPPPTCEEYYCSKPAAPDHGFEIEPNHEYVLYDVVSFSCDDGFILRGAQSIMCTGNGDWHPSIPNCYEDCVTPFIANGNANFAPGISVHDQDQLNVSCDISFTREGVNQVTCYDGEWYPAIGHCFNKCESPVIPNSDHSVNHGDVDHGDYEIITCNTGYTFGSGSDYSHPLTCNNGTWDAFIQCSANCDSPQFPDSMMITPVARVDGSYYQNDVITITCAPNHEVINGPRSASMPCDNGQWTPTLLPVCKHINDN